MSKQQAQTQAIELAKQKLAGVDLAPRCAALGLPLPQEGVVRCRAFGIDFSLDSSFNLTESVSGKPAKLGDHIFVLHYLLCDVPVEPTGQQITFRDLPGGQFYWQPFLSRSINPLLGRIGNDVAKLRDRVSRFDWTPAQGGDFAATIHAIGKIDITLVYHLGDEELGPAANVLFDTCIKRVFVTEDAAWLASRICIGLL